MLKRLIGMILTDGENAFITTKFNQLRRIGTFQSVLSRFENYALDEIMILNISQKLNKRINYQLFEKVFNKVQINTPISLGGGVTNENYKYIFSTLAERIVLGPKTLINYNLFQKIREVYGDQSIILNLPLCKVLNKKYIIVNENKLTKIDQKVFDKFSLLDFGGELLVIDVKNQGCIGKFDWKLLKSFLRHNPKFKIILNGGFNSDKIENFEVLKTITGISSGKFLATREIGSHQFRLNNSLIFRQVTQYGVK